MRLQTKETGNCTPELHLSGNGGVQFGDHWVKPLLSLPCPGPWRARRKLLIVKLAALGKEIAGKALLYELHFLTHGFVFVEPRGRERHHERLA